jgi:carbon monoxide dehydrogenase subunit G
MGLKFESSFVVKAPADRVWAYLTDPYRVAPALPGAAITEKVDDRTYKGTMTVKVGPVSARYKGTAIFEALDPAARTAEIAAKGQDMSGRGGADMHMSSRIVERAPGESEVTVVSDVNVTGILAQFGRGLMQDVSDQMLKRFTDAMRVELEKPDTAEAAPSSAAGTAAAAPAPPIEVVSFGSALAGRALVRALRQPVFWIVIPLLLLAIYWLWFR